VKSAELYQLLRAGLRDRFEAHGFKRAPRAQCGWHNGKVFIWFQCDQWGWDQYAGSSFFVNFQAGGQPIPWDGKTDRLQQFLTHDELETMRHLQNEVVRHLPPPPPDYVDGLRAGFAKLSKEPDRLIDAVLARFRPVETPYRFNQDVSLRYFHSRDVEAWAVFLRDILPRIAEELGSRVIAHKSE
jgi:hypothetical protein